MSDRIKLDWIVSLREAIFLFLSISFFQDQVGVL